MFTRLGQLEAKIGKRGLDFFQTHPSSESRVKVGCMCLLCYNHSTDVDNCFQLLEERIPEAHAILSSNPDCEGVQRQLEAFKETAHPMRRDKRGGFEIL